MKGLHVGREIRKKLFVMLVAVLTASMLLSCSVFAAGAEASALIEVPDRKIILEGTPVAFKDVPITTGGRTLLPLRELVTALGVPNDDDHIKYRRVSSEEQYVTVTYGDKNIELTIGKPEAYVNGEKLALDVAPVIYKSRTYIPLRFVAEALGKKVVWVGETNTVLIVDQNNYDAISEIIAKYQEAWENVIKYRMVIDADADISIGEIKTYMHMGIDTLVDNEAKALYMGSAFEILGISMKSEAYFKDNMYYATDELTGEWKKKTYTPEEYDLIFRSSSDTVKMENDEKFLACLTFAESADEDELVLVGNSNFLDIAGGNYMQQAGQLEAFTEEMPDPEWYSVKLVFDRNTYLLKSLTMDTSSKSVENGVTSTLSLRVVIGFSDINGDFEITVPEEAVRKAVEDPGIDLLDTGSIYDF